MEGSDGQEMASAIDVMGPNDVLDFWFGGDWHLNYKEKWFATGESQLAADQVITGRFQCTLTAALAGELDGWKTSGSSRGRGQLALIIVLDQFSRHIFRHLGYPSDAEQRQQADALALQVAEELTTQPCWQDAFTVAEHVFALMPFRHNADLTRLRAVLRSVDEREAKEMDAIELINKFRKQTLRRLQHLEDRSKAQESTEILERFAFQADESKIMSEPLVRAVESFLVRHLKQREQRVVAISLSGGVDSMVIAKILCVLRDKLRLPHIVAIHIDYANREESSREADFVEQWSLEMQLDFHLRTINEVTRGITDRSIYERVARDIRYGFYQQVLKATDCSAVMFGHHAGDVQENVISNIMRGCSPLQLSGMTETGVANGVNVWRPLLHHPKSDIFDFAHRYGVPYFKDTTPSWSTRGKLRRQLVPLLIDMYGDGFLRNLSTLATESDDYRALVHANIFQPFLSAVQTRPCGLAVNVLPFRQQPLSFWKEMLKELMHSMSMSMIRDKAVCIFMERIQRPPKSMAGWLELRKGFHTFLLVSGELVVLRAGVLSEAASRGRGILSPKAVALSASTAAGLGGGGEASMLQVSDAIANWTPGFKIELREVAAFPTDGYELQIGVWTIRVRLVDTRFDRPDPRHPSFKRQALSESETRPPFMSMLDLLPGVFTYQLSIGLKDELKTLVVWTDADDAAIASATSVSEESVVIPLSLQKIEPRFKLGMPLLVWQPISSSDKQQQRQEQQEVSDAVVDSDSRLEALSTSGYMQIELQYSYIEFRSSSS